jgi:glycerate kinase
MEKIVLIPDSFKGSMSSTEVCQIMERAIFNHYPQCEVVSLPMADGGEGSVVAYLAASGGELVTAEVSGPYFEKVEATYLIDENFALIEMASCAGLSLVKGEKNPAKTTTFGVGELILDAIKRGCRKILVGLGGSGTVDGGVGVATALGVKFLNKEGESFVPTGGSLKEIVSIDLSTKDPLLEGVKFLALCDVENPLLGERGAARVFGPQKGATPEMVEELEEQLTHLFGDNPVAQLPGSGAAGGMGGGMAAFLDATLVGGTDFFLTQIGFDNHLEGASLVITGEGKIDSQSLGGKVVSGVAQRSKVRGVPVIAVVGDIGKGLEEFYKLGVTSIFSINSVALSLEEALKRSKEDLYLTLDNLMRLVKLVSP